MCAWGRGYARPWLRRLLSGAQALSMRETYEAEDELDDAADDAHEAQERRSRNALRATPGSDSQGMYFHERVYWGQHLPPSCLYASPANILFTPALDACLRLSSTWVREASAEAPPRGHEHPEVSQKSTLWCLSHQQCCVLMTCMTMCSHPAVAGSSRATGEAASAVRQAKPSRHIALQVQRSECQTSAGAGMLVMQAHSSTTSVKFGLVPVLCYTLANALSVMQKKLIQFCAVFQIAERVFTNTSFSIMSCSPVCARVILIQSSACAPVSSLQTGTRSTPLVLGLSLMCVDVHFHAHLSTVKQAMVRSQNGLQCTCPPHLPISPVGSPEMGHVCKLRTHHGTRIPAGL